MITRAKDITHFRYIGLQRLSVNRVKLSPRELFWRLLVIVCWRTIMILLITDLLKVVVHSPKPGSR